MGLKNRGKKLERKEKSKVKLKAKKLLPKGQNVTDVSFKIKKIVVREQLKAANQAEPLTRRKLNVKELLSRLQHYNTNVRQEGLSGLKELVTFYPSDSFVPHLAALIEGVTALILDQETLVRRDSLKLLRSILTQVSCDQIAPFFDVLRSYLSCAMTHIHTVTQEDSLLLLDVLLETTPSLVADNSQKILPNFLDMISKLRTESRPGRTLTVNLGSKLTSVKWRIKVLTRLHGLLSALVASKTTARVDGAVAPTVRWDTQRATHVSLCYPNRVANCELSGEGGGASETTGAELRGYMDVLMPLLFETWLEVAPTTVNKEKNLPANILTAESAELLGCILEIIQLSWEYIQCWEEQTKLVSLTSWFKTTYDKEVRKYLLPGFPYSQTQAAAKRDKRGGGTKRRQADEPGGKTQPRATQKCTRQNLATCHVVCCLHDTAEKQVCGAVLKYTTKCVRSWSKLDADSASQLTRVLRLILLERSRQWMSRGADVAGLVNQVLTCYASAGPRLRQGLFELLGDVVLDPRLKHLHTCSGFDAWQVELAGLLCEPQVSVKTVQVLTRLACHNDQHFLGSLVDKLPLILRNLPTLEVVGAESSEDGRISVANLIYWVADKRSVTELLAEEGRHWDKQLQEYVSQLVSLRHYKTQCENPIENT